MSVVRVNVADHDLLVILNQKVSDLQSSVDDLKDGVSAQIADHEVRIKGVELVITQTDLLNSFREFQTLKQQVRDFAIKANFLRIIGGIIGGLIFFILTQLPNWLRLSGWIK